MSLLQNFLNRTVTYYPAELHETKEWYISYYVLNPYTNKMVRCRVKVNRVKSITARRKFAREIIISINQKLSTGWNPFIEQDTTRSFIKYKDAVSAYFKAKAKELQTVSIGDYNSFVKRLDEWSFFLFFSFPCCKQRQLHICRTHFLSAWFLCEALYVSVSIPVST